MSSCKISTTASHLNENHFLVSQDRPADLDLLDSSTTHSGLDLDGVVLGILVTVELLVLAVVVVVAAMVVVSVVVAVVWTIVVVVTLLVWVTVVVVVVRFASGISRGS